MYSKDKELRTERSEMGGQGASGKAKYNMDERLRLEEHDEADSEDNGDSMKELVQTSTYYTKLSRRPSTWRTRKGTLPLYPELVISQ